ncbi:MAG: GntR family transcriptional regulator, transcriptional repressor for pyruvate dehydrogenase complex [Gaiellaceae bacterium]|nr:GntR family transcriptional regulator, transcriptional repressor for pyruvate dehydrogenase complex [Gaiellaceae bacterium]
MRSQLTRSEVASQLESEVLSGGLEAGTKLPSERELALRLGVSRPLVREALRSLVERGLVEISPGRGAFVRAASTAEAVRPLGSHYLRQKITPHHLIEVRMIIEPAAARLAATRATDQEIDALGHAVEQINSAENVLERARWDITLHALVARMSRNPVIETTFESIATLVFELMLRSLSDSKIQAASAPFHKAVYEAIRDRDPDRAYDAMLAHHESGGKFYGKDLDSSLDVVARRELERLLGPTATLESVIVQVMHEQASADGGEVAPAKKAPARKRPPAAKKPAKSAG